MAPNSILASQLLKIFLGPQPPDSSLDMHCMLIFCFAPYGRCIQSCLPNLKLLPPPLNHLYTQVLKSIFCLYMIDTLKKHQALDNKSPGLLLQTALYRCCLTTRMHFMNWGALIGLHGIPNCYLRQSGPPLWIVY